MHIPGLRHVPNIEIAAVCAAHMEHARACMSRYHIPAGYDDYRQMFAEAKLDAVTIATPPSFHHPIAIAAVEAGLHILCEKPMAKSAAEARDMWRLVKDAGLQHAVDYEARFVPPRIAIKRLVAQGYLGEFQTVSLTVYRKPWQERPRGEWQLDAGERVAGALGALGTEYIDTLRWWFGDVHAVAGGTPQTELGSANFGGLLRFANGGLGTVHISSTSHIELGAEFVITGTDAMLALQADGRIFGMERDDDAFVELEVPDEELWEDIPRFSDPRLRPFVQLAREWVRGIRFGASIVPSFEDGMKVQEVVDSIERSQALSRWIDTSGKKWPV